MTAEIPPGITEDEPSGEKRSKLQIGRDTLFVLAGVAISMSAGITPAMSIMFVREGIRYLESKLRLGANKP